MNVSNRYVRAGAKWSAIAFAITAAAYGTYVGVTWYRYGNAAAPTADEEDPLLDRFLPAYEIAERHQIRVAASAAVTFDAARDVDLQGSPVVRTIIRAREVILGRHPTSADVSGAYLRRRSRSGGVCWLTSRDVKSSWALLPDLGKRTSRSARYRRISLRHSRSLGT